MDIRRYDIVQADLGSVIGSEQGGKRPVLIIQNDVGNRYSPTTIVAVITSKHKKEIPTHVFIHKDCVNGLKCDFLYRIVDREANILEFTAICDVTGSFGQDISKREMQIA